MPISEVVGDFNRDGKLDVAVVGYARSNGQVQVFLGNGDGTFVPEVSYAVGVQPFYAAAASLRNNGILDLVVGDSLSTDVYVMLGNGDGTFQPPVAYPTSGDPIMVGTGDFIGGGKPDIIALTQGAACDCVELLPGNGDGTFGAAVVTPVPYNIIGAAIAAGDFNGDGKLDVAVGGAFGAAAQVDILLGNGDGTFTPDGYYAVPSSPSSVAIGRFTGSKNLDLAVANLYGPGVSVLLGNGDGTFQQAVNYDTYNPSWVAVGDLNGDGKEDLVASNAGNTAIPPTASVSVLMGNGDGTFQPEVVYPAGESDWYVAIGDFNGDHKPDLATLDTVGGPVITLLNTGVVSFSPTTPLTFGPQLIGTHSPSQTVTLTNTGTATLTISSISLQGGGQFSYSHTCGTSVAPGGNCTISARSKPTIEGNTGGTITLHDSASSKPMVIELAGAGTVVKLQPSSLTFPPTKNGTKSKPQKIQLTNTGSKALDITSIKIGEGIDARDFYQSNNCGSSVNAGASCTISVIFAPRQTGSFTETVVVTDNGGGSPQTIPLSGNGD